MNKYATKALLPKANITDCSSTVKAHVGWLMGVIIQTSTGITSEI